MPLRRRGRSLASRCARCRACASRASSTARRMGSTCGARGSRARCERALRRARGRSIRRRAVSFSRARSERRASRVSNVASVPSSPATGGSLGLGPPEPGLATEPGVGVRCRQEGAGCGGCPAEYPHSSSSRHARAPRVARRDQRTQGVARSPRLPWHPGFDPQTYIPSARPWRPRPAWGRRSGLSALAETDSTGPP